MTLDDQLDALDPLTQGAIAKLAGHTNPKSMSVKRVRGSALSRQQLLDIARGLRGLAEIAEEMAQQAS